MFLGKTIADRARNQKRQWWDKKAKWSDKKWRSMNKDSAHRIFFQKHQTSFTGFSQLPRSRKGKCDLYPGKRFRHEIASVAKGAINVSKVATVNFTSNSTKKEILLNYVLDHLSNTGCPKKVTFRMLLEPQCTGSINGGRRRRRHVCAIFQACCYFATGHTSVFFAFCCEN